MNGKSTKNGPRKKVPGKKGPGRPSRAAQSGAGRSASGDAPDNTREKLLRTARAEFVAHGFRGSAIRRIADNAGVTPAMIHYHFGDKQGLYLAVMENAARPLLAGLAALREKAGHEPHTLEQVFGLYARTISAHPEMPVLMLRDVLSEQAPMREAFIENFATRGSALLRQMIDAAKARGEVRKDVSTEMAMTTLLSLAVFPFLARPVLEAVLQKPLDADTVNELILHNTAVIRGGLLELHGDRS